MKKEMHQILEVLETKEKSNKEFICLLNLTVKQCKLFAYLSGVVSDGMMNKRRKYVLKRLRPQTQRLCSKYGSLTDRTGSLMSLMALL